MRTFSFCLLLLTAISAAGCAKIAHLQELLRIKNYSDNKDVQAQYVKEQDRHFEQLLEAIKNQDIKNHTIKDDWKRAFGEPVFARSMEREGVSCEQWLYRKAVEYFHTEKVYVYFSPDGKLIDWEHVVP